MTEKYRVQFDFTAEAFGELEYLKAALHASTRAEVVRFALRVLQWTMEQLSAGGEVLVRKEGRTEQVVFPFLMATRPERKPQAVAGTVARG